MLHHLKFNKRLKQLLLASLALVTLSVAGFSATASALSGSEFNSGRIIDDAVFYNANSMTSAQIQQFLEAKVPVCDTNGTQPYNGTTRAAYGTSRGYPPPYTCLKDYRQNITAKNPEGSLCNGMTAANNVRASEIIYRVAQSCGVSPKVLIVLLEKEQSLVTDDWPWSIQYRSATGYGCPDSGPNFSANCDASYYGFYNQVYEAARIYKFYAAYPHKFNHQVGINNYVSYNPNSNCGGSNVFIQNQATVGLYNYTPYQPNAAALNNLYGTGDGCSAYGNRNFWRLFTEWFGSTQTDIEYGAAHVSQTGFIDSGRTQQFNRGNFHASVPPGGKAYFTLRLRNNGIKPWSRSVVRLGTSIPNDRCSAFKDDSWLSCGRIQLVEESVAPGNIGTFNFSVTAPQTTGRYRESFNLLAEGVTWFNRTNFEFFIDVVDPRPPVNTGSVRLNPGQSMTPGQYFLSSDLHSVFAVQTDGNVVLYNDARALWSTRTAGYLLSSLIMQGDGNLVLYGRDMIPAWSSGTAGNPGAYFVLQTDGNAVVYSSSNQPLWSSGTSGVPNGANYVTNSINTGNLRPWQELRTTNGKYRMIFQPDGNLVIYSDTRAIWSSGTAGQPITQLSLQGDGNLVIYGNGKALWSSGSAGNGASRLIMQDDGNAVIYNQHNQSTWSSGTAGIR